MEQMKPAGVVVENLIEHRQELVCKQLKDKTSVLVATLEFKQDVREDSKHPEIFSASLDDLKLVLLNGQSIDIRALTNFKGEIILLQDKVEGVDGRNYFNIDLNIVRIVSLENMGDVGVLLHELGHASQSQDEAFASFMKADQMCRKLQSDDIYNYLTWKSVITPILRYLIDNEDDRKLHRVDPTPFKEMLAEGDRMAGEIENFQKQIDAWYLQSEADPARASDEQAEVWEEQRLARASELDSFLKRNFDIVHGAIWQVVEQLEMDATARAFAWAEIIEKQVNTPIFAGTDFKDRLDAALHTYKFEAGSVRDRIKLIKRRNQSGCITDMLG